MTTERGLILNHLAAPILAGIITAAIVSWWRNRK
ncbi:type I toxin-antitoxin system toxin Ldr family protein [Escherichia coli]|nr:type I toxin-antitoxin system toxin Ldr family protein [Escherichia coli]